MKNLIKGLIRRIDRKNNSFSPLINVYLSSNALIHNLNQFRTLAHEKEVAPVLKGNAYGHGLKQISYILRNEKVPFFVVDSYFEARALRNENIKTPLLIIGYVNIDSIIKNGLKNICFTISSIDTLRELSKKAIKKTIIHIKIDTGMHRQGILFEEIDEAIKILENNKNIILEGICSHLADADGMDSTFTKNQIIIWNYSVKIFKERFPNLKYWHISNTAGIVYNEAEANMTRLGIGLYGLTEIPGTKTEPILEVKTIISSIKKIKKGDNIGYACTFIAPNDMTVATIPMGYFEGIDRRLSNKGYLKIGDVFCPIVGRVSMNITIIDISKIDNPKIGDEIIVISNKREDKNSVENIAKICETIPYEMAVPIGAHLKRNIV